MDLIVPAICQQRDLCPNCGTPLYFMNVNAKTKTKIKYSDVMNNFDHYSDLQAYLRKHGSGSYFVLYCERCRKGFYIDWGFVNMPFPIEKIDTDRFKPKPNYNGDTEEEVKHSCDLLK